MKKHIILLLLIALQVSIGTCFAQQREASTERKISGTAPSGNSVYNGHFRIDNSIPINEDNEVRYTIVHSASTHQLTLTLDSKKTNRFVAVIWDANGQHVDWRPGDALTHFQDEIDISKLASGPKSIYLFVPNSLSPFGYIPFN